MVVFNKIINQTNKILFVSKNDNSLTFNLIKSGDLVSVRFIRLENDREMEMSFFGVCIRKTSKAFVLRNLISGVVVEQSFSFFSPLVTSVAIVKYNSNFLKVKRAQFNNISHVNASLIKFNFSFSIKSFLISQNLLKTFFVNNISYNNNSYFIL